MLLNLSSSLKVQTGALNSAQYPTQRSDQQLQPQPFSFELQAHSLLHLQLPAAFGLEEPGLSPAPFFIFSIASAFCLRAHSSSSARPRFFSPSLMFIPSQVMSRLSGSGLN